MKLVIATKNKHKLKEISQMLEGQIEVVGLDKYPQIPETIEDGKTFEENALKKAREVFAATKTWTLADDSGLEVEALKGEPGIYSARYAGAGASYEAICQKLLKNMDGVPEEKRDAQFNCTMALISPDGEEQVVVGLCKGHISQAMKGEHGFGYDPVFVYDNTDKTLAEISSEEKNKISHRANALKKIKEILKKRA
ncbi:XTP/dITP diphosphatase [Candidatus Margulisiibacteriota bacterium]